MLPKQEKEHPNIENRPLALEAALLFSQLLSIKGIRLQDHSDQLIALGERLLPQARNLHAPIDRDAFIRKGPGVGMTDVLGGSGDKLGWTFKGEFRSADETIEVKVEKTDKLNGRGVVLAMHLEQGRNRLSMWASDGFMNSGSVYVKLNKYGKEKSVRFVRQPYIFHKTPLKLA